MTSPIDAVTVDDATNRAAREAARRRVSWPVNLAPASVTYESAGHTLLLGDELAVRRAAAALADSGLAAIALLITEPTEADADDADVEALLASTRHLPCRTLTAVQRATLRIEGYLGRFAVGLEGEDGPLNLTLALLGRRHADLVLDLGRSPTLALELPPPGYRHLHWDNPERDTALAEFAELVGGSSTSPATSRSTPTSAPTPPRATSAAPAAWRYAPPTPSPVTRGGSSRVSRSIPTAARGWAAAPAPAPPGPSSSACPNRHASRRR